jgi:cobalt-zinc-cadmium efflux system outer membrane protein
MSKHEYRLIRAGDVCCFAALLLTAMSVAGCRTPSRAPDRADVSHDLFTRSGHALGERRASRDFTGIQSQAVLTESHAIDLALLNNAAFQEQLVGLALSRADLVQAGLITNPDALLLAAVGPKQLEATITAPIEALWLRGSRLKNASIAADRAAATLVQSGLDLIRDVRLAYADMALAKRKLELLRESAQLRGQVAKIAESRVRAGDAVPLDAAIGRIDAIRAEQESRSLAYVCEIAEEKLRALIGAGLERAPLMVETLPTQPAVAQAGAVDSLLAVALAERPDMKAAELGIQNARKRASLARIEWLNVSFVADANERGASGFEAGPGVRFTLPIFNQNQGVIARADAELERQQRQRQTLNDRVILEVRESHLRVRQAEEDLASLRGSILPESERIVALAERSYRGGDTPLIQVLESTHFLLDARTREAQATADLRRALADLERNVGRRLDSFAPASLQPTIEPTTQETSNQLSK